MIRLWIVRLHFADTRSGTCRVPLQNRCPESGRASDLWACGERLRSSPSNPIFLGARPILISRVFDGLIEAGGCPGRSGLRRSSVVLVNQATQDVPTCDRVVGGERRDVFRSLRCNKVEPAMGSLAVVVLDIPPQH
jgi:hypothetical protein